MFPFLKNRTFIRVDYEPVLKGDGGNHEEIRRCVFELIVSGQLKPQRPIQKYSVGEAEDAFRTLASGKSIGKVVLTMDPEAVVPKRASVDSDYRFSTDATYVIAGGLGGLGRQIALWMARRGAAHILLLSRSGIQSNPERLETVSILETMGVQLEHAICDITHRQSLQQTIEKVADRMPPIKGCFQAAMVIEDRPFETMTHDEWRSSVRPKVNGTWNLHSVLPAGMDFFVMLSSATCIIGNKAQANYSAGNTFQDALARCRVEQGEKAFVIDLGMVLGEGWVAERKHIQDRIERLNFTRSLSQSEVFAIFDYCCDPRRSVPSAASSQIVTGLQLPQIIIQSGRQVPDALCRPLFREMHQVVPQGSSAVTTAVKSQQNFASIFKDAGTISEAALVVAEALKLKLCKILGLDPDGRKIDERIDSFGVDSLIALEIRNWIAKEIRADVAIFEILGDAKVADTALTATGKSEFRQAHWDKVAANHGS